MRHESPLLRKRNAYWSLGGTRNADVLCILYVRTPWVRFGIVPVRGPTSVLTSKWRCTALLQLSVVAVAFGVALRRSPGKKMPGDADKTPDSSNKELPAFPGEDFHAHAATQWMESATTRLTEMGLITVAEGGNSPEMDSIVDIELDDIPSLDESHHGYLRREELRIKTQASNRSNTFKR